MQFQKSLSQIGLDFNEKVIRLVELEHKRQNFTIREWAEITLPNTDDNTIIQSIKSIISQKKICTRKTIIAMPPTATIIKQLNLPSALNDHEIINYIENESQTYFGYSSTQLYIDYLKRASYIQAVAARREEVQKRANLLSKCDLNLIAVDAELLALERILHISIPNLQEKTIALFYIKTSHVFLCAMQYAQNSYLHAENYSETSDNLNLVMRRLLHLYNATFPNQTLEAIFLAGEFPFDDNWLTALQQQISLPIHILNPLSVIQCPSEFKNKAAIFSLALSLALWRTNS